MKIKFRSVRKLTIGATVGTLSLFLFSQTFGITAEKISKQLQAVLDQADRPVPVVVVMKQIPLLPHTLLGHVAPSDVENMIKSRSFQMQQSMRAYVKDHSSVNLQGGEQSIRHYKFFWAVNALMATATPEAIAEMTDRDDVQFITFDYKIRLARDFRHQVEPTGAEYTYGLQKIGVPQIREQMPELTGQGVVVGILDTGVDSTHPELENHVIAFKDFVNSKEGPAYDDNGHGTHCAGTISGLGVGGTQIGIAPGVKLVVGKVFGGQGSAQLSDILRGMEWIANPDGQADSKMRPRVVNNSWGGSIGEDLSQDPFSQAVLTWVQLNIFPSFAAGNEGPGASTMGSPGGLPQSFGVGATDSSDKIADFSSRGPVKMLVNGQSQTFTKPDISAPGYEVYSSMPGGQYGKMSGTSMATPHVTGSVALLVATKPTITVAEIRQSLEKAAQHLGDDGKNNTFGSGRLNIFGAVQTLSSQR